MLAITEFAVTLPEIVPPVNAKAEFALLNAAAILLFCVKSVAADNVAAELAAKKAAVILLFCVSSVAAERVAAELAARKAAVAVFVTDVILVF